MNFYREITKIFRALVNNENLAYSTGDTATPASGAPGAMKQLRANAAATIYWWACALNYGNLSAAGPTVMDYQISRLQDGTGTSIALIRMHLLATATMPDSSYPLPVPVKVAPLSGAGAQQATASGKTLDVSLLFATGMEL